VTLSHDRAAKKCPGTRASALHSPASMQLTPEQLAKVTGGFNHPPFAIHTNVCTPANPTGSTIFTQSATRRR
jgi:hypothetical protein